MTVCRLLFFLKTLCAQVTFLSLLFYRRASGLWRRRRRKKRINYGYFFFFFFFLSMKRMCVICSRLLVIACICQKFSTDDDWNVAFFPALAVMKMKTYFDLYTVMQDISLAIKNGDSLSFYHVRFFFSDNRLDELRG